MQRLAFLHLTLPYAEKVEQAIGINRFAILAHAALESGWGSSHLALTHHNFFGLTGYGAPNANWTGQTTATTPEHPLKFRSYRQLGDSFLDYGRLIQKHYPSFVIASANPSRFAHAVAYSPYISERNGDDRSQYEKALRSIMLSLMQLYALTITEPSIPPQT